jgi:hypothetical protein
LLESNVNISLLAMADICLPEKIAKYGKETVFHGQFLEHRQRQMLQVHCTETHLSTIHFALMADTTMTSTGSGIHATFAPEREHTTGVRKECENTMGPEAQDATHSAYGQDEGSPLLNLTEMVQGFTLLGL